MKHYRRKNLSAALQALAMTSFLCSCTAVVITDDNLPPIIASVSPSQGAFSEQIPISISGKDFSAGVIAMIGTKACLQVSVESPTLIKCVAPPQAIGSVDVTVFSTNGQKGILTNGFSYISAVTPVPGTAVVTLGGGISKGTGITMQISIGEPASSTRASASGVSTVTGLKGNIYSP